jgi:nucleoside-diphosphate-sugar epimerase
MTNLSGKKAIVTGANSGLGYQTALELARRGAQVVLAVRNLEAGEAAATKIMAATPEGAVSVAHLDLSSLDSVSAFEAKHAADPLDILVNNAGIMGPAFAWSKDGIESQMATNHIGHFALTAGLLPALCQVAGARVVSLSSVYHRRGKFAEGSVAELRGAETGYDRWARYGQTKLACLMFALELDRRVKLAGLDLVSVAAHPGWAATGLQKGDDARGNGLAQSAAVGARSQIMAATETTVVGGSLVGPRLEIWGKPRVFTGAKHAYDKQMWASVWASSEELAGVKFTV